MRKYWNRTPKNYKGSEVTTKSLGSLCKHFLQKCTKENFSTKEEVFKAWSDIMGERLGKLTQVVSLKNGLLTIKVQSSVLYSMLSAQDCSHIIAKLQEKIPYQVNKIKFWYG